MLFSLVLMVMYGLALVMALLLYFVKCSFSLFISSVKDAISNAESASSHLPTRDTSHPSLNSSGEESNEDDLEDEELEDDDISTDEESKVR